MITKEQLADAEKALAETQDISTIGENAAQKWIREKGRADHLQKSLDECRERNAYLTKKVYAAQEESSRGWGRATSLECVTSMLVARICALESERVEKTVLMDVAKRWRKDAEQYQRQVDEARKAGTPHDQMLAAKTFLTQCAKELESRL